MIKENSKFSAYAENEKPISIKTPSTQRIYDFDGDQIVVSVVLINYNQGHYLEEALNSIINQNYSNIEIIVIDGGSTDNSMEILKKYPGVKWISEPDNSSGHAFAKGVELTTGEIVYFLASSDGFFDPNWIKTSVDQFCKNENVSLISADVIGIRQSGTFNGYKWPQGVPIKWHNKKMFFNWLFKGIGVTPITFGIRKDVLSICAPNVVQMVKPTEPDSVDYFWHLFGNFFYSGYIGIKIPMISSFVRFHTDRVDDSEYLSRQRNQLHRLIVKRRRQLLSSKRSAKFLSPTGEIVANEKIFYFEIVSSFLISKITNMLSRIKKDPFDIES
jgi:glycosyltransferase involved in cell wall biosynthesis